MAGEVVVEAVRHPDLGRRRADCHRRRAGARRANPAPPAPRTRLAGALHMSRGLRLIPIILLLWLVIGLAWKLVKPADTAIPSQMVERPVPPLTLPPAVSGKPGLTAADLATGQAHLLNIFASWCVPCTG